MAVTRTSHNTTTMASPNAQRDRRRHELAEATPLPSRKTAGPCCQSTRGPPTQEIGPPTSEETYWRKPYSEWKMNQQAPRDNPANREGTMSSSFNTLNSLPPSQPPAHTRPPHDGHRQPSRNQWVPSPKSSNNTERHNAAR